MSGKDAGGGSERLRELHHAATDIMAAEDRCAVYETTVETAKTVLGFDFCTVFAAGEEGFEVAASSHYEHGRQFPEHGGVLAKTYRNGESFRIDDVQESPVTSPTRESLRAALSVPLGESAVLQAVSTTPGYYSATDLELAELLVVHAEAALDQVRSRELIREQKQKIEKLHAVATELDSCHTHGELFDLMREASKEILGFGWCTLYLLEDGEFVVGMASERSPVEVGDNPFPEGNSKAREVLETGDSLLVDDVHELDGGEPTTDRIRSALQVPVGELGVYTAAHERPGVFDESDIELAELLAGSIAEAYERIEARQQLRAQKRELEQRNDRLDQFTSVLSHDLRNPLNVAQLQTELARRECESERFETIERAHERMENMIEELLAIARAESASEETEQVSLATRARQAWAVAETPGADLSVDVPNRFNCEANPDLLGHVFENLFRNAVEHGSTNPDTDADGSLSVEVGLLGSPDSPAGFYVEDDGRGIPPEKRDDVFDHGYSTAGGGTGFGLSIVREFVEAHGWGITVTEGDDGGARFEIAFD